MKEKMICPGVRHGCEGCAHSVPHDRRVVCQCICPVGDEEYRCVPYVEHYSMAYWDKLPQAFLKPEPEHRPVEIVYELSFLGNIASARPAWAFVDVRRVLEGGMRIGPGQSGKLDVMLARDINDRWHVVFGHWNDGLKESV